MYTVECKSCGNFYESKANRPGICPDCKKTNRGRNNTKYRDKTYQQILLYVPKGSRDKLKEYVSYHGMSMNEFINKAIDYYIDKLEKEEAAAKEEFERQLAELDNDPNVPF